MAQATNVFETEGNVVTDGIELRQTASGDPVANFTVAHNRGVKKGDEWDDVTTWIDCVVWGKLAENCVESLTKGMRVFVKGRLDQRPWEDKDGNPRIKVEITCDVVAISLAYATVGEVERNSREDAKPAKKARKAAPKAEENTEDPF